MSDLKVRVLLYDEEGNFLGEADVLTSADLVYFEDGDSFQQKYDKGELRGARGAIGPQGPIGPPGATGPQGPPGVTGLKGDKGETGPQGPRGYSGMDGQRGSMWFPGTGVTGTADSVTVFPDLEIAYTVGDIYLNTDTGAVYECVAGEDEIGWIYKGIIQGPPGEKGEKGATGATGPQGPKGETGDIGPQGPQGDIGVTGPQGPKGDTGATGATGTRGSRWSSGTAITGTSTTATVFSGSGITDALVNDYYLNTSTGYVYRCTVAGAAAAAKWVYAGSIKGATGATGAKGATGATGPQGPKGDSIKVGSTYAAATEKNIYFKII